MGRLRLAFCVLLALALTGAANAAPTRNVHSIDWFVHIDLIDVGAGKDLAYYQALIEDRSAEADRLVQGHQGPVDNGCCVELDPVTVSTFGTTGDGLDVIQTQPELDAVLGGAAGGYLVEAVWFCASTMSMTIRGCAISPGDRFAVGLEADDNEFLPEVIAHERGHNTGLNHVSANPCELMSAGNGGGCLSVSECNSFITDADTTSGTCACLDDTIGGAPTAPGSACTVAGGGGGICNGGSCGVSTGEAGSRLLASGGTGAASGNSPNALLEMSTLTGDWDSSGAFGVEINGLAYDEANGVLYGIEARIGDDALVIVDEATGTVTSTVAVLTGREKVIALAFDPQPAGDRLFAIENDDVIFGTLCSNIGMSGIPGDCASELFEIDPGTGAQTNLGELNSLLITDGVQGLAWDDGGAVLYAATPAGLDTVDLASCNGSSCGNTLVDVVFYDPVSLSFDAVTGQVVRVGHGGFGETEEAITDPTTGALLRVRGIDPFTAGGLTARPVPEPGTLLGLATGALALAALGRRKHA